MNSQSLHTSIWSALRGAGQIVAILGCVGVSGCASIGLGSDLAVDNTATGSIASSSILLAGIDPSDWQIILDKISNLESDTLEQSDEKIAWNNPQTGSKGHISQIKGYHSVMQEECRSFKSSMHRVTGVENVKGEICKGTNGAWQITGFTSGATV